MGTVLLDFGQCGCQIGIEVINQIENQREIPSCIQRRDSSAYHQLLVDTEPKILKPLLEDRKKFSKIDPKNIMFYQYGRGNNWGLGYMDSKKKKLTKPKPKKTEFISGGGGELSTNAYLTENGIIIEQTLEKIRREIEKTDQFLNILIKMSLAGGTGSGLGSRIIEELRDTFPGNSIDTCAVFPNISGETPLQHYNCLLSLTHLQKYADSIIYFQNERLCETLQTKKQPTVQLDQINQYIASCLVNMFKINDWTSHQSFYQQHLRELCIMPETKFIELVTTTQNEDWEQMISSCSNQIYQEWPKENDYHEMTNKILRDLGENNQQQYSKPINQLTTLSASLFFRSNDSEQSIMKLLDKKIKLNPVKWNQINTYFDKTNTKTFLTMFNSNKIIPLISNVSQIAYQKYRHNAYLHWYYKYGIEKDDFDQGFETMQCILDNYTYLYE